MTHARHTKTLVKLPSIKCHWNPFSSSHAVSWTQMWRRQWQLVCNSSLQRHKNVLQKIVNNKYTYQRIHMIKAKRDSAWNKAFKWWTWFCHHQLQQLKKLLYDSCASSAFLSQWFCQMFPTWERYTVKPFPFKVSSVGNVNEHRTQKNLNKYNLTSRQLTWDY